MNIRNFITNIFSSSQKKQQPSEPNQQAHENDAFINHSNKSQSDRSEEDLLSNLRRSNLFFDEIGRCPNNSAHQNPQLFSEQLRQQSSSQSPSPLLQLNVQIPATRLIHIEQGSNSNASRDWEMKLILPQPKESTPILPSGTQSMIPSVEPNAEVEMGSNRPCEFIERVGEVLTPSYGQKRNNQLLNFSDFINSLKKDKMEIDHNTASSSSSLPTSSSSNCIFFDRRSQHQLPALGVAIERMVPDPNPFLNKTTAANQNQSKSEHQDENVLAGGNERMPVNAFEQACQTMVNTNNRSLSKQLTKMPSRVRGSSSKKKEILIENHSLANSSSINHASNARYNGMLGLPSTKTSKNNSKRGDKMIVEEDLQENVYANSEMNDAMENLIFDLQSNNEYGSKSNEGIGNAMRDDVDDGNANQFRRQRFFDSGVSSTRAEPPTHVKNRENPFFFGEENHEKMCVEGSQIAKGELSDEDVCGNHESDAEDEKKNGDHSIEARTDGDTAAENTCFELMRETNQSSQQSISRQYSSQGKGMCAAAAASSEANDMSVHSNSKSRSNTSSPNRVSLTSFHKQIEMMIDKSEILPHFLTKSANKVPSPIKEVEECSQRNQKITPSRENEGEDNHSACNRSSHCVLETEQIVSPKFRLKSVKFEDVIATPLDSKQQERLLEEEDHSKISESDSLSKAHDKLQSRRPTPYNHFKSGSSSYLSRQQNNNQFNLANQEDFINDDCYDEYIGPTQEQIVAKATHNNINTSGNAVLESRVLFRSDSGEDNKREQFLENCSSEIMHDTKVNEQLPSSRTEKSSDLIANNLKRDSQRTVPAPVPVPVSQLHGLESSEVIIAKNQQIEKNTNALRPVKLPLALKKSDFIAQMKATVVATAVPAVKKEIPKSNQRNNFFRSESSLCFTPFHHKSSDSRSLEQDIKSNEQMKQHGISNNMSSNSVIIENQSDFKTAAAGAAGSRRELQFGQIRIGFENTNKRKIAAGDSEKLLFSDCLREHTGDTSSGKGQKSLKENTSASNPLPRKIGTTVTASSDGAAFMLRSTSIGITMNASSTVAASNATHHSNNSSMAVVNPARSVFKVCVICHVEIKPREESKVFSCCHKSHITCLPKDKNAKCPRCNSTQYLQRND